MFYFSIWKERSMKKLLLAAILCFICSACSTGNNSDAEKAKIEQFTEQVGKEAAEGIKKPINKARKIDELAKERVGKMEQAEDQEKQ
jgi:hypothetical protein